MLMLWQFTTDLCPAAKLVPPGTVENSPAIDRWDCEANRRSRPVGTREGVARPSTAIHGQCAADVRASLRDATEIGQRRPSDESPGYSRAVPTGRKRGGMSSDQRIR